MIAGELGKVYKDREVICREGDKGDAMYVVQSGEVRISKQNGKEDVDIATLGPGEIFGEMALFDKAPRSATAAARGGARVLSIDRKKLFTTISRDPTLVFKILETMSSRIRKMNSDLSELRKKRDEAALRHLDLKESCSMILSEAKKIIPADNGSLMLLESDGSLSIQTAFGIECTPKQHFFVGEGIAGDVIRTGKAELVNDVSSDERFRDGCNMKIVSLLCAPIKFGGHCLGVMNMSNCSEKKFTIEDLKLLHSLAIYASVALQNAVNFSGLKDMTERVLANVTILDTL
jgi:CRP-like cAMP-binding protein